MVEWLDIATAPKDGTKLLVFERGRMWISHYNVSEHFRNGEMTYRFEAWTTPWMVMDEKPEPTHWMPLPDPPESGQ